jgi:hypothetical protein
MAFQPGFLAVESASGLSKGQCRSSRRVRGVVLVGRPFLGSTSSRAGRLTTTGRSKQSELASAAAARMLTLTTSAGRTGAFGCRNHLAAHDSRGPSGRWGCEEPEMELRVRF